MSERLRAIDGTTGGIIGGASIRRIRQSIYGGCAWCGRLPEDGGVKLIENPKRVGVRLCARCLVTARWLASGGSDAA